VVEFDHEAHAKWCEKWCPRCPDGNPQLLRHPIAFRERNLCELELRVPLAYDEHGVCQVVVDEHEDEVYVRVVICYDEPPEDRPLRARPFTNCPVRVWLEHPLGQRAVIDVDSDVELDEFCWLKDGAEPKACYRPANRRRKV
jgi:hypothetical protein